TGLSTLERPADWPGPWVQLPPDDTAPPGSADAAGPRDATAGGVLHWVPLGRPTIAHRASALSSWLAHEQPALVVVDVSVEAAALVRLHGVPVVSVVLPGERTDAAHLLGLRLSSAVVACWPEGVPGMLPGLPDDVADRVRPVGAVSRVPVVDPCPAGASQRTGRPRVAVLQGRGGGALTDLTGAALARLAPGWDWTELGGGGAWVEDPAQVLRTSDVVVANAGQNSLAEIASCRTPAVVVPADRPHAEQATTARVLAASGLPVVVVDRLPHDDWSGLLEQARRLDGSGWSRWSDGHGAERFATVVEETLAAGRDPR
ncbi:MAG: undecaprenyldiphospho-muramoylpentapeptide beta-N-acetylglucosaminyltransferase, partial [Marmoricola sp.]|nr:undecaprenyldiphospho-muramoylpentapeptide beta-N-acetylglucosaminyltransferase [Marmoricola sp.]